MKTTSYLHSKHKWVVRVDIGYAFDGSSQAICKFTSPNHCTYTFIFQSDAPDKMWMETAANAKIPSHVLRRAHTLQSLFTAGMLRD